MSTEKKTAGKTADKLNFSSLEGGTKNLTENEAGTVWIPKEGDKVEGVFMGETRKIGEGQNETRTFGLFLQNDIEQGRDFAQTFIVPLSAVLLSSLNKLAEQVGAEGWEELPGNEIYLSIQYEGRKQSSSGSEYKNFSVSARRPVDSEKYEDGLDVDLQKLKTKIKN